MVPSTCKPEQAVQDRLKVLNCCFGMLHELTDLDQDLEQLRIGNLNGPRVQTDVPSNPGEAKIPRGFVPAHGNTQKQEKDNQG